MARDELRVVESDGQHVWLMWGELEIVASIATGMLQMAIMGSPLHAIRASQHPVSDELGEMLIVGAQIRRQASEQEGGGDGQQG